MLFLHLAYTVNGIKPSSHRRPGQEKTILLSAIENFEAVLYRLEMRRGLLKTVLTCRQFRSHH